jgi:sigma-B regulation protein RsbU (phosphoserine phosphatase)
MGTGTSPIPASPDPQPTAVASGNSPRAAAEIVREPSVSRAPVRPGDADPLSARIGRDTLQRLQDRFAAMAHVSMGIATVDGRMITDPSWGDRFSELVATSPLGGAAFREAIRNLATTRGHRAPSVCHPGEELYGTPIQHRHHTLALLVVGTRPVGTLDREVLQALADRFAIDPIRLAEAAEEVETWTLERQRATYRFADLLGDTLATLYEQSHRIRRQYGELKTVYELADLLAGTGDLQQILNHTMREVVEHLGVKACAIRLLNEETGELLIQAVWNLSPAYLHKGSLRVKDSPIVAAALRGEEIYIEDAPTDARFHYREEARREGIVSGLCLPMSYRGRTVGVLRVYTGQRRVFTRAERSLVRSIAALSASAITSSRLVEAQREGERIREQLRHAGEVQRRMLPRGLPTHPAVAIGCAYRPTLELSGDFYDLIATDDRRLGLCVADVSGKGIAAALMMSSIRATLRTQVCGDTPLVQAIERVNRQMCRDTLPSEFATLFYGEISVDGRRMTYCNAGHPPGLLLRGEAFRELDAGGPIIGVLGGATFQQETLALQPGDLLVLYTDGVTEALDFHDQAYGTERLLASIRRHQALAAPLLAEQLLWDIRRFAGLAPQTDDITIVVARVTDPS